MDDLSGRQPRGFDLATIFVHLEDGGAAVLLPVDEDFWSDMDPRLERGRLVSRFRNDGDWPNWEMHPSGDELVLLLSGRMTFIMEGTEGSVYRTELSAGEAILVPRGTWHTADVPEPAEALFVTPGSGTRHRPREPA